jgi:cytochrome d ubiquinol oxidase subunit II
MIAVFLFGFLGLAYSIYPFVVIDQMTIWQAASDPSALKFILVGVCISVPAIAGYRTTPIPFTTSSLFL